MSLRVIGVSGEMTCVNMLRTLKEEAVNITWDGDLPDMWTEDKQKPRAEGSSGVVTTRFEPTWVFRRQSEYMIESNVAGERGRRVWWVEGAAMSPQLDQYEEMRGDEKTWEERVWQGNAMLRRKLDNRDGFSYICIYPNDRTFLSLMGKPNVRSFNIVLSTN